MAYFTIRKSDVNGQYYFRFLGANHEQILSSELYYAKQGCINGIDW